MEDKATIGVVMDYFVPGITLGAGAYAREHDLRLDTRWSVRADWMPENPHWDGVLLNLVDMDHAMEKLGSGIIRCGNLDPVSVIQDLSPEEIKNETEHLCKKEEGRPFIFSGGCEITVNTPVEHLLTMRTASQPK